MSNDKPDYYAMAEGISKTIGKVTKPLTDAQFIALAGAVAVYVEKALAHEAEKQAGPVAEPIGYLNPKVLGPDGKIAATDALTHSGVPVGGWTLPIYAAPPSESGKEDASACISAKPDAKRPHRPDDFCPDQRCGLIGQCAARAKKEQQ